ncbi:MAG TPA: substrate-binding domain-containing protein, partial [Acidimicrobiia bacterium]
VVGFNDMPYSDRFSPPMTTVRISQYDLGWRAARLLVETIGDPSRPAESQLITPQLVIRGSTTAART